MEVKDGSKEESECAEEEKQGEQSIVGINVKPEKKNQEFVECYLQLCVTFRKG